MIIRFIVHHPYVVDAVCLLLPLLIVWLGWRLSRRRKLLGYVCCLVGLVTLLTYAYGRYVGASQLEVRRVEFASADLPDAFDGYRIVQFSDAHVGSFIGGREDYLQRAVDSINAQKADAVVFTGDLQNISYDEIEPFKALLGSIQSRDGIYSVLGNHDYAEYIGPTDDPAVIDRQLGGSVGIHHDMGWRLLRNGWHRVRRDSACIYIAGMENDGEGRFPQLGNHNTALRGISRRDFVVMLEHDPSSWRRRILPHTHVQLTLSGHTHGGQMSLFGWSPACLRYKEYDGLYYMGPRAINVSRGIGGVLPFRLGAPGEIVVITLLKKK